MLLFMRWIHCTDYNALGINANLQTRSVACGKHDEKILFQKKFS